MRTTRCAFVSALFSTCLFLGYLRTGSGQAPAQSPPAGANAAAAAPASGATNTAVSAQEKPIRELVDAFAKAYSTPDLKVLAAFFTDEANVVDSAGETTRGKSAIVDMYRAAFQENPRLKLEPKVEEIQFLTPDVARAEGQTRLSTQTGDASEFTRFNNSFLIRDYQVEIKGEKATSGTVFIGWDPQTGQIKSWLFDSDGGHGEGLWTRTGENEWVVKAQGVLRDGRPTSATQIHVVLNKDSVKTSSIDRIVGVQIAPDIADVVMVRKPPEPGGAPSQPATAPGTARDKQLGLEQSFLTGDRSAEVAQLDQPPDTKIATARGIPC